MDTSLLKEWIDVCYSPKNIQVLSSIRDWLLDHSEGTVSRPLFNILPELSVALFGLKDSKKLSTFQQQLSSIVWIQFLSPQGPFFQKLLGLQDTNLIYELGLDAFNQSIRKIILCSDWSELPQVIRDRIQSKRNSQEKRIIFNMFEYYLFCCAQTPLLAIDHQNNSSKSRVTIGFKPAIQPSDVPIMDQSYLSLVKNYLDYLVPSKSADIASTPQRVPLTENNTMTSKKPQHKDIFTSNHVQRASLISQFTIQIFINVWLGVYNQNDTFIMPTRAQVQCIALLTKHVVSLNLSHVISDQSHRAALDGRSCSEQYEQVKSIAYKSLRQRLYWFILLALQNWPRNDSISNVVDLWIDFITPWQTFGGFNSEWNSFVQENYLFYSELFLAFLVRARTFDLYSCCQDSLNQKKYLLMIEKVFSVFKDQKLVAALKMIENSLLNLDQKYIATPKTARTISPMGSPRVSKPFIAQDSFQSCGPMTRAGILSLVGKFSYKPIMRFVVEDETCKSYYRLIFLLRDTLERLQYLVGEDKDAPISRMPQDKRPVLLLDSFFTMLSQAFSSQTQKRVLSLAEKDLVSKNIKKLENLLRLIEETWNINKDEPQMNRTDSFPLQTDQDNLYFVSPGVLAPDLRNSRLTMQGKQQVIKGTRKSDPNNVSPTQVSRLIIHDHEIEILVKLLLHLANSLDKIVKMPDCSMTRLQRNTQCCQKSNSNG